MIIIKTKNGDHFINEKAVIMVEHDRENTKVNVHSDKYLYEIKDAEGIIYTNDAQPTSWKDEGSEIQRLMKSLDEQRECIYKMRDEYLKIEQERDELKERVAQLEPKTDPDRWWPDCVDSEPISVIICRTGRVYEVKLGKIFERNSIKTVGDLLRIGRRNFRKYGSVGGGSIRRIDEALHDLYGIRGW